jgi:hypothetical protein
MIWHRERVLIPDFSFPARTFSEPRLPPVSIYVISGFTHWQSLSTLQYVVVPVVWEFSSSVLAPLLFGSFLASHESWAGNSSPGWDGFELGQGTYTLGGSIFVFQKHLVSRRTSTWSWLFMVQYWIDRKYYIEWAIHCGAWNMPEFRTLYRKYLLYMRLPAPL